MEERKLKPDHEIQRRPESNLRNYYMVLLETGMILALLLTIGMFKVNLTTTDYEIVEMVEQEAIEMEEIVQTQQRERVTPPPRPPVPVAVPNHEIIEDIHINIDAELDLHAKMDLTLPPPPPPREKEPEEANDLEEEFFVLVEQMPELIGGLESLQREIQYPERAIRANIQGRVYVQFIVNERGGIDNPKVVRGIGGGCDEEALRVVGKAKFKPGLQRGRPVKVQYNLPVIFIIRE